MLLSIVAPLVICTKSLIPLLATDARVRFDAAVATAGLLSYVGLVSYIWRPQRMTGKSVDCSWRGTAAAEGHFETADHSQQGIAVPPAGRPIVRSSLVRRLVLAKDDPAKQRIRAQLCDIDDEQLFALGSHPKILPRCVGTAGRTAEANLAQRPDEPSEDGGASQISRPNAAVLDEKDDMRRH